MKTMVYDGTFAGWLSAVFDVYDYKISEADIIPAYRRQDSLFAEAHMVLTEETKAVRVWNGLQQRVSETATTQLYRSFLSELRGMENILLQYVQYAFSKKVSTEYDYTHPAVLFVTGTARKVHREKHRMEAFVRFQQTKDKLYYAIIEPDFNVLPLIRSHFENRYADQRWMIYDVRRKYGLYYDLTSTEDVQVDFNESMDDGGTLTSLHDEKEPLYQRLWQNYFDSVNIKARKNMKLHIRHMPLRYWKYLPEKKSR